MLKILTPITKGDLFLVLSILAATPHRWLFWPSCFFGLPVPHKSKFCADATWAWMDPCSLTDNRTGFIPSKYLAVAFNKWGTVWSRTLLLRLLSHDDEHIISKSKKNCASLHDNSSVSQVQTTIIKDCGPPNINRLSQIAQSTTHECCALYFYPKTVASSTTIHWHHHLCLGTSEIELTGISIEWRDRIRLPLSTLSHLGLGSCWQHRSSYWTTDLYEYHAPAMTILLELLLILIWHTCSVPSMMSATELYKHCSF